MANFRGFISIDLEPFQKLLQIENEIKKSGADIKLVEPENIHLTLKFLGDTDVNLIDNIEGIMKESIEGIEPFNIKLKEIGVFPNKNYLKIVWIGIENSEKIKDIAIKIDKKISKLGFDKETRGFSAHLTIARVKSPKNKDKLLEIIDRNKDIEVADFKVENIRLKKSELTPKGPIYTTLREVKL